MCWGNAYGNPRIHEESREPSRKGDRSTAMGHAHLQGRTRRERTLEASRRHKSTSRIRTSGAPGSHPRHDSGFINIRERIEIVMLTKRQNKSPGVDGISPTTLKETVEQISMPLAHVFNMSLQEGIVPLEWKEANIIPPFKKGSRNKSVN